MRIGVHCFPLKANIGGVKQYFLSLFGELLARDHANEYVFFHNARNLDELAQLPSDRWREHAVEVAKTARVARQLKGLDLYFSPFTALIPRPLPLPTVVMIPDNQEVFLPELFSELQRFTREWHYQGSARMADRVLTISEFSKRTIAGHYGVSEERIGVTPLCADPRYACAPAVARRPSARLPEGKFLFFPGNRWQHKNHDTLLRGLRLLAVEKKVKLDLVLTGYDMADGYPVAEKAAEYGIAEQVYSVGYVSVEEMAWLYTHAEMTVFPSLFEGFGLPLVEAMSAGCPVACSRAGSLPEVGGEAVEYFDPASPEDIAAAIERVAHRPGLREGLIQRGRERAALYSPARLADLHLQAFDEARRVFSPWRYLAHAWWGKHAHARAMAHKYPAMKAELQRW